MTVNEGPGDRIARVVFAVLFAVLIAVKAVTGTWAIVMGAVGVIFLVTAAVGLCPLYSLLGIRTRARRRREAVSSRIDV